MTTDEVAKKAGVKTRIIERWAAAHGVAYTGEGMRKTYNFSEADLQAFLQRPSPGRPSKPKH
ncbi:MAG: helix-turn-helix domain-containing protein [Treponematales bacterium]